jgi:hypothetical protein
MRPKKTKPAKIATRATRHATARTKSAGSARHEAPKRVPAKTAPPKGRKKPDPGDKPDPVAEYRHDEAKRKNNPPAKIAAEGTVPVMGKIRYEYSPRLSPVLRFDRIRPCNSILSQERLLMLKCGYERVRGG